MSDKKTEKKPDNELDINFGVDTLVILGRIDCPKLTHCRALISNILDKITSKNMKTHFVICFETQFESLRNYLLKKNLGFIDYPDSPIIYIQQPSGDKIIIGYTPVDLRPIFNFKTSGNASSNFPIPYSKALDRYELTERAMFLRSMLDVQIQPENLYQRVKSVWDRLKPFTEKPLPTGLKTKVAVQSGRKTDTGIYTYGISYAGKVRFGDEIDPYVTSVTACAGSYSYPVWILACEFGGTLRLVFTQSYESDALVRNICREMAEEIPGTTFKDWGHHRFDEFLLTDIQHLHGSL